MWYCINAVLALYLYSEMEWFKKKSGKLTFLKKVLFLQSFHWIKKWKSTSFYVSQSCVNFYPAGLKWLIQSQICDCLHYKVCNLLMNYDNNLSSYMKDLDKQFTNYIVWSQFLGLYQILNLLCFPQPRLANQSELLITLFWKQWCWKISRNDSRQLKW